MKHLLYLYNNQLAKIVWYVLQKMNRCIMSRVPISWINYTRKEIISALQRSWYFRRGWEITHSLLSFLSPSPCLSLEFSSSLPKELGRICLGICSRLIPSQLCSPIFNIIEFRVEARSRCTWRVHRHTANEDTQWLSF